ncbi:MAG: HD domain-containing protein [Thermodesulfovibrionales bacterium]
MGNDKWRKQLKTFIHVSSLINSTLDPHEIRERTINALTTLLDAEAGSLLLVDEETGELFFEVATGEKGGRLRKVRLKRGEGIAGWVAEHDEPVIANDAPSDPRFFKTADQQSGFVTKSIICVPVISKGKIVGVIEGINKISGEFSEDDLESMNFLSDQVAIAIENARLYKELKDAFYGTVEALAEVIELRDPYTGGHTKRVMDYSMIIGSYMGLDKKEMENLRLAAILHDIGKIGIRDDVLLKQEDLDADGLIKMRMHPHYGAEILSRVKQLRDVIPGVRDHHERYDGEGYPGGIKGDDIPIIARIISLADTFDAMTTDRPYRKGLDYEEAVREIERCSATQFDQAVVNAFLTAWKEGVLHKDKGARAEGSEMRAMF